MSQFPSPKEVERIKKMYPKGRRILIERMNDLYHPIERGTMDCQAKIVQKLFSQVKSFYGSTL